MAAACASVTGKCDIDAIADELLKSDTPEKDIMAYDPMTIGKILSVYVNKTESYALEKDVIELSTPGINLVERNNFNLVKRNTFNLIQTITLELEHRSSESLEQFLKSIFTGENSLFTVLIKYDKFLEIFEVLIKYVDDINKYITPVLINGITVRLTPLAQIGLSCCTDYYNLIIKYGGELYPRDVSVAEKKEIDAYIIAHSYLNMYLLLFKDKSDLQKISELFTKSYKYMYVPELQEFFEKVKIHIFYLPMLYVGLTLSNINMNTFHSLVNIYNKYFVSPINLAEYSETMAGPIFSQKGVSCGSDAIFAMLLESDNLSSLWGSLSDSISSLDTCPILPAAGEGKISASLISKYRKSFSAAIARHERIKRTIPTTNLATRRKLSNVNTHWENMLYGLNTGSTNLHTRASFKGLKLPDVHAFFDNVFNKNIFSIPDVNKFRAVPYKISTSSFLPNGIIPSVPVSIDDIIGCYCMMMYADDFTKPGHYISFFKNGYEWYLADNEIGYLHKFNEPYWVQGTLLPRLIKSVKTYSSTSKATDLVYYYDNPSLKSIYLNGQFVCFGEKNYPMVPIESYYFRTKMIPYSLVLITKKDAAGSPVAVTGGGSAAATHVGGARNKRKTRRIGKTGKRKSRRLL